MLGRLANGAVLPWRECPFVDADSVRAVLDHARQGVPGILQPRRPVPDVFMDGGNTVRPRHDLVIKSCIKYSNDPDYTMCAVYEATCGTAAVIVKLFIEEIDWPNVDWTSGKYDKREMIYVVCPEFSIVNEIRSYRLLRPAQGSIVPYSLGFYRFDFGGIQYVGLVMEQMRCNYGFDKPENRVWAVPPGRYPGQLRYPISQLLTRLLRTLIEIHKCDVAHGDMGTHNLFVADRDGTPDFALFDYASSGLISMMAQEGVGWDRGEYYGYEETSIQMEEHAHDARKWHDTPEAQELIALLKMTRDQMPEEERAHRFFVEPETSTP